MHKSSRTKRKLLQIAYEKSIKMKPNWVGSVDMETNKKPDQREKNKERERLSNLMYWVFQNIGGRIYG